MMKLDDVQSKQLLPRFADDVEWIQQAFDVIVKHANDRAKSIDAPLSMEAIQALTDEELQTLYEQYGIAIYYPDLTRETREKMLFEMCRIYRYLGTPKAIETLCNYIFDGVELNVKVVDNQAFDENGRLVNPSMLDTFDIEIDPQIPVLDANAHARLLDNIIHFSRNSQGLNGIDYDFTENFDLSASLGVSGSNPVCAVDYINDAICEPVPIPPEPQVPTLTLDLCLTDDAQAVTFSANDYWFAYFSSEDDKQSALDFGLTAFGPQQNRLGGFSEGFEVEILALLDANHDVVLSDTSNFYLSFMSNENGTWAVIRSIAAYSTPTVFWLLRITKPDVLTGYYKQGDGYLYWDSRRTIKIKYSDYDVRTCVRATEYIDPRWADRPGYGDGTRDIDPSKVSLQWYSGGGDISPHFDSSVSIWNDSIVVIEYTLYKEMTLHTYLNENGILFGDFQPRITSNSTESDINNAYIGLLKTGTNNTGNTVSYDSSKRYELGYYSNDNIWTPFAVQSLSDMPDSTVSTGSTQGYLLVNRNGYLALWLVTNYNGGSSISTANKDWKIRVYNK